MGASGECLGLRVKGLRLPPVASPRECAGGLGFPAAASAAAGFGRLKGYNDIGFADFRILNPLILYSVFLPLIAALAELYYLKVLRLLVFFLFRQDIAPPGGLHGCSGLNHALPRWSPRTDPTSLPINAGIYRSAVVEKVSIPIFRHPHSWRCPAASYGFVCGGFAFIPAGDIQQARRQTPGRREVGKYNLSSKEFSVSIR